MQSYTSSTNYWLS